MDEPLFQNAMTEVGDTGIGSGNAALGEQFTDGAIGDAAFAKRGDVIFERQ